MSDKVTRIGRKGETGPIEPVDYEAKGAEWGAVLAEAEKEAQSPIVAGVFSFVAEDGIVRSVLYKTKCWLYAEAIVRATHKEMQSDDE